uniref:Meiosis-specific, MEI4 homolog (S. cerevisiae) n=1 Tax=Xiphophorus maculatus TaxID=8083 RepID=A0A3B5R0G1_XIPMA
VEGSGRVPWRLIKAQVAVAMAVIRSRPPGVSGRQHGEALGHTLRRQDGAWRERAQALQQEVLRLRQELLVSRATANTNSSWETAGRSLFCTAGAQNQQEVGLMISNGLQSDPWSDALLPHMRFLQSLCSLQRLDGSSAALAPEGHGGSAASETILLLLDSVAAACGAPTPPGLPDLLPQACRAASRALDLLCSGRPSADLRRRVEEALRELTRTLLHSRRPAGSDISSFHLSLMVLTANSLIKGLISIFLQVQESSALRTFPLDRYQNSCHLLWVLERLLPGLDSAQRRPELEVAQTAFLHRLELRVFLLWDEFPLFSVLMWRIGKLLF